MAKSKASLLEEAKKHKLDVSSDNTVAEITKALESVNGVKGTDKKTVSQTKKELTDGDNQEHNEAGNSKEAQESEVTTKSRATAKAGKRSAKGLEEAEAKVEKIEHQKRRATEQAEQDHQPTRHVKPTRTRLERRGKKFRKATEQVKKDTLYSLKDAMDLAVKTSPVAFDASVELHIRLGVDPRQADQNIRANLVLPEGTGKSVRVAVFSDDDAGNADLHGVDTIMQLLEKGTVDFDILISTPANMAKLGKYARLLGPRGLMPNPKSGTVTPDVAKAVQEAKAGKVEYRVDSTGIVHLAIGKVSFGDTRLLANAQAVMSSIKAAKPTSIKGIYIKAIHVATTMGPGIPVSTTE
jgi:large subunit ribosomal protein L1